MLSQKGNTVATGETIRGVRNSSPKDVSGQLSPRKNARKPEAQSVLEGLFTVPTIPALHPQIRQTRKLESGTEIAVSYKDML